MVIKEKRKNKNRKRFTASGQPPRMISNPAKHIQAKAYPVVLAHPAVLYIQVGQNKRDEILKTQCVLKKHII